jgi:hypothetical protein
MDQGGGKLLALLASPRLPQVTRLSVGIGLISAIAMLWRCGRSATAAIDVDQPPTGEAQSRIDAQQPDHSRIASPNKPWLHTLGSGRSRSLAAVLIMPATCRHAPDAIPPNCEERSDAAIRPKMRCQIAALCFAALTMTTACGTAPPFIMRIAGSLEPQPAETTAPPRPVARSLSATSAGLDFSAHPQPA